MLLSAWIRSSTNLRVFVDISRKSQFEEKKYCDFSLKSKAYLNPARDYGLLSQILDLSGDFSFKSSYQAYSTNDMSFKTGYLSSSSHNDYGIISKIDFLTYSSFSANMIVASSPRRSFSIELKYKECKRSDFCIKSFIELESFLDLSAKMTLIEYGVSKFVSFSLSSSFIEEVARYGPVISDFEDMNFYFCNMNLFEFTNSDLFFNIGKITVDVNSSLNGVLSDFVSIRVIGTVMLNDFIGAFSRSSRNLSEANYEKTLFDLCSVSVEDIPLSDLYSPQISMSIIRPIEEHAPDDKTGRYSIGLIISDYEQEYIDVPISLKFISINYALVDSKYCSLISPFISVKKDNRGVLSGEKYLFWINKNRSRFTLTEYSLNKAVHGYSSSNSYTKKVSNSILYIFYFYRSGKKALLNESIFIEICKNDLLEDHKSTSPFHKVGNNKKGFIYNGVLIPEKDRTIAESNIYNVAIVMKSIVKVHISDTHFERIVKKDDNVTKFLDNVSINELGSELKFLGNNEFMIFASKHIDVLNLNDSLYSLCLLKPPYIQSGIFLNDSMYDMCIISISSIPYIHKINIDGYIQSFRIKKLLSLLDVLSDKNHFSYFDSGALGGYKSKESNISVNKFRIFDNMLFDYSYFEVAV